MSMILPISLTIAAAAALLHVWLASRVSQLRRQHRISVGDDGNPALLRRMRAHANFGESTPLFLILLALIEHAAGSQLWLWGAAILFILARILHAFGMDRQGANRLRAAGMGLSVLVLVVLAGFALYLSYTDRAQQRRSVEIPQAARAAR
jgi:uncharacterized membrane protein YecN with MAPEG domain